MHRLLSIALAFFLSGYILSGCTTFDSPGLPGSPASTESSWTDPPGRYYPAQLHLHGSMSEGSASMAEHDAVAASLGTVDVLWWTDHDWRIARHGALDRFDFEEREQAVEVPHRGMPWSRRPDFVKISWRDEVDPKIARHWADLQEKDSPAGGRSLEIGATASVETQGRQNFGVMMDSPTGRLKISLAADVTIKLHVRPLAPVGDSAELRVTVLLSRQPDGPVALAYALGGSGEPYVEDVRSLRTVVIPTPAPLGIWTQLELPITRDAERFDLGGWDNSLRGLHLGGIVRRGATAGLDIDALRIEHAVEGTVVLQRAEQIAQALQEQSGIVHHVGLELSYSAHMNAYLPQIELPDFEAHPHGMTHEEMVSWVHERGGLVSYNHVFGTIPSHLGQYKKRSDWLLKNRGFGADLLEVGYPHRVLPLQRHLEVWDKLSRRGVVIGGIGTSDSHNAGVGWEHGNNYVTWVFARSPNREDLLEGLRTRRAFFGDPTLFHGTLELRTVEGDPMGSIVPSDGFSKEIALREVELIVKDLPADAVVRWVVQGRTVKEMRPPPGDLQRRFDVRLLQNRMRFVRAEVWLGERGIAFSNCLYFEPLKD